MKMLYAARVEDLGPSDYVLVECRCGHSERLTGQMLRTAGVPPYQPIQGLERRFRSRECDERGRVDITIKWAP